MYLEFAKINPLIQAYRSEVKKQSADMEKMGEAKVKIGQGFQQIQKFSFERMHQVRKFSNIIILVSMVIAVAVGVVIVYLSYGFVVAPIRKVASELQDIAQGEGDLTKRIEIKSLAGQTSNATENIKAKVGGIQDSSSNTVEDVGRISTVISDVNEIVTTIAAVVEEQSAGATEVAHNVAQASTGIGEVNENVAQASQVAEEIAKDISGVNTVFEDMSNLIMKKCFLKNMGTPGPGNI